MLVNVLKTEGDDVTWAMSKGEGGTCECLHPPPPAPPSGNPVSVPDYCCATNLLIGLIKLFFLVSLFHIFSPFSQISYSLSLHVSFVLLGAIAYKIFRRGISYLS